MMMNKKAIPKGYKQTKIGVIPVEWSLMRTDKVLERIRKKVEVENTTLYQQIGIRSHAKGIFHKELVSGEILGNKSVFWIEEDCFIVNIVFAWEQAVAKTTHAEKGLIASHRFPMYQPKNNQVDIDYILYFFKSKRGKYLLGLASPGGAGRNKTLGQKEFAELKIPIPALKEQQKIAKILTTWDRAIERQEALILAKEEFKKGLMQRLLSGDFKKLKFELIFNRVAGKKYQINAKEYLREGKYPVIDQGKKKIIAYSNNNKKVFKNMSIILFGDHTRTIKYIDFDFIVGADGTQLLETKENFDNKFFYYQLLNKKIPNTGYNRHFKFIKEMTFNVPPLKEQQKIAQILTTTDKEIELLKNELEVLKEQKQGLMQRLLMGEVRCI